MIQHLRVLGTFILVVFFSGSIFGQFMVQGTVSSPDDGPLIGVTVQEENTTNGTLTNLDGKYSLEVSDPEAVLIFSYVGLETQRIEIANRSTVDVVLKEDSQVLDEVVVTALGFEEKEDELGYASSKVDAKTVVQAADPP
jgi:hypothetical protein